MKKKRVSGHIWTKQIHIASLECHFDLFAHAAATANRRYFDVICLQGIYHRAVKEELQETIISNNSK